VKIKGPLALLSISSILLFLSCNKINETTELGDELIPTVDNVNTFDTVLNVEAAYFPFDDSSVHFIAENMALGKINDPAFGTTTADMYFNLSSQVYGASPFLHKDSVLKIDSVILSLSYRGAYGDTTAAGQISVQVSEISDPNFYDTVLYRFDHPGFTSGSSLGGRTFSTRQLKDSVRVGQKRDTVSVANVLRIPLNNSIGEKLKDFGAAAGQPYYNDTLFRKAFRGLAVKTTNTTGSGTLAYFNTNDITNTRLIVYYQYKNASGVKDTATAVYTHSVYSQANSIKRSASGEYLANLSQSNSQKLYIQSSPTGSYIGMKIPGLDAFPNRVIHRAELIAYSVPSNNSSSDQVLTAPNRLFLDHKGTNNSKDSAYLFEVDIATGFDGSLDLSSFGGTQRSDKSYRFNITRYVQGIVTRHERNDSLRLYAPLRSIVFARNLNQSISIPVLDAIAKGRVVIANSNYFDTTKRLRLRIVYSNL
jgi:hypothetical protein